MCRTGTFDATEDVNCMYEIGQQPQFRPAVQRLKFQHASHKHITTTTTTIALVSLREVWPLLHARLHVVVFHYLSCSRLVVMSVNPGLPIPETLTLSPNQYCSLAGMGPVHIPEMCFGGPLRFLLRGFRVHHHSGLGVWF